MQRAEEWMREDGKEREKREEGRERQRFSKRERGKHTATGSPTRELHVLKHGCNLAGSVGMCAGDRDLHGERAPAKIFINLSRKHALEMKNKQMYKCNLRQKYILQVCKSRVSAAGDQWE